MAKKKQPLVRGAELTERGKTKLRAQITRADSLLRTETKYSESWYAAQRMKQRAIKLLGKEPGPSRMERADKHVAEGVRGVAELTKRAMKAPAAYKRGLEKAKAATEEAQHKPVRMGKGVSRGAYERHFRKKKDE